MPTQQSKLLDMMADAPLDQLFQSAYIPQPVQQKQNQDSGIIMPGMMAGATSGAVPASTDLLGMMSEGQQSAGSDSGGGWGGLFGAGGTSNIGTAGFTFGGDPGNSEGPQGQDPNVEGPENGTMSIADMLGLMFAPILGPVSIAKAFYSAVTHANAMTPIVSQMSIPEAMSILQSDTGYGFDGLAPAGYGMGDPAGGGYDSPGGDAGAGMGVGTGGDSMGW
jgi:hypothetical protein